MIFLAFLILFSAIAIASCAAYFSIIGLKMLFVGSGVSIVIMGIALEVGKFIAVTFLKQKWNEIDLLLKTYLIIATIVLMGITSVGIYGYLSAGYNATAVKVQGYEQTIESNLKKIEDLKQENVKLLADPTNQSEIELINTNKDKFVSQRIKLIEQKEQRIRDLRSTSGADKKATDDLAAAKAALDADKATLDAEVNKEVEQIKLINNRLLVLDEEIQNWLKQGNRGLFKTNGADKAREVKIAQEKERAVIDSQIKEHQNRIQSLRDEHKVQTQKYSERVAAIEARLTTQNAALEQQIKEIENEIVQIRQSIDQYNVEAEKNINEQVNKKELIIASNKNKAVSNENTIQGLLSANTTLKEQIIHTDVGTFKFVANSLGLTLDKTVTYFIAAIMLVFDPLAVCLVLCFNFLIKDIASKKKMQVLTEDKAPLVDIEPTPTPEPTPKSMKSSEIIFGQKKEKPKHPPAEGEVERIQRILEEQRKEKAERNNKSRPA